MRRRFAPLAFFWGLRWRFSEGLKFCRNIELQLLAASECAEGTKGGGREKIRVLEKRERVKVAVKLKRQLKKNGDFRRFLFCGWGFRLNLILLEV